MILQNKPNYTFMGCCSRINARTDVYIKAKADASATEKLGETLAMKELALSLNDYEGLDSVINNPITTQHLKTLING